MAYSCGILDGKAEGWVSLCYSTTYCVALNHTGLSQQGNWVCTKPYFSTTFTNIHKLYLVTPSLPHFWQQAHTAPFMKHEHTHPPASFRALVEDSQRLKTTEYHQNKTRETVVINKGEFTKWKCQIILEMLLGYKL